MNDIEDLIPTETRIKNNKILAIKKNFKKLEKHNKLFDKDQKNLNNSNLPGNQKIYVKTFGCSHNTSDSEFMMGQLVEYGYELTDDPLSADCLLINSCTVKNPSQDKLMRMVFDSKEIKKPCVVSGCVPQGDHNINGLLDVSILGVTQIDRVVEVVEETIKGNIVQLYEKKELPALDLPKIRKNRFIEIIPINTGCLGNCTYCKTKHARGVLGSYKKEEILKRMLRACDEGVKEIWITSEDTGAYGRDIGSDISELLVLLTSNIPENVMLRVGMTNPPYILEHLQTISEILNHPRVFTFLHIPVQAGNNVVLERMNREYTVEEFEKVCDFLIEKCPDITIATDIICGFPGETNEEFEDTLKLIEKYKFPVVNISQFYPRPGTIAARMKQCNTKDKKDRSRRVTTLFESIKENQYQIYMNTEQKVWFSEEEEKKGIKTLVGHTKNYIKVTIPYNKELVGSRAMVKIDTCLKWNISGKIMDKKFKEDLDLKNYFNNYYERKKNIKTVKTDVLKKKKLKNIQNVDFKELSKNEDYYIKMFFLMFIVSLFLSFIAKQFKY